MIKKFLDFIKTLTDEVLREGKEVDELIAQIDTSEINLFRVNEELEELLRKGLIDEEEADTVKSILVYIFMKNTDIDPEDIYALVFGEGKRLSWH